MPFQIDLANTLQQMGSELARVRQELSESNKDLTVCKTRLGAVDTGSKPGTTLYKILYNLL